MKSATEFCQIASAYENSLSAQRKKTEGIFYTDLPLAEKILKDLSIPQDATVLDPCCGTGSFNYAAKALGIRNIFGTDKDGKAISICTSCMPELTFRRLNSLTITARTLLSRLSLDRKPDYIVGNPPYAKWVPEARVSRIYNEKVRKSGSNLFIAGMIKAMEFIKEDGIISYIIPKNFLHIPTYGPLRKEILQNMTIVSITDIGAHFKDVRGEQIILTLRNARPASRHKIVIKRWTEEEFRELSAIEQSFFQNEVLLFNSDMDIRIYKRLNACAKLDTICTGYLGRGRSKAPEAITGREIRKFGYKNTATPRTGNRILIQNIYSAESGIIAAFGGELEASQTVTVLTDGNEKKCRFILGLLHSRLCNFFLYRYCYNYSRLTMHTDAEYLKKIPLPDMQETLLDEIYENVIALETSTYMSEEWFRHAEKLNKTVYRAFRLNETEVDFIENEMKCTQSNKWF